MDPLVFGVIFIFWSITLFLPIFILEVVRRCATSHAVATFFLTHTRKVRNVRTKIHVGNVGAALHHKNKGHAKVLGILNFFGIFSKLVTTLYEWFCPPRGATNLF